MDNHFNTPSEIINLNLNSCENKTRLPLGKMILLGIMAGIFIAFGAATSSTAAHAITNVGLARTVAGTIFPVGLMLIVFLGGELFTGNCLIILDVISKRVTWLSMIRNLVIVYFSNLIGALIIDFLIFFSGNLNYSDGLLGAYTIKVAVGKLALSPVQGITSGILCNVLVCLAVLMAASAKDIAGKVWAIFFPICAFVVGGFEHCVANMYYIPAGILAASNPAYAAKAQEVYGITEAQLSGLNAFNSLHSFIPVTLGNIIGGMLLVGLPLYLIYKKEWKSQ
ncbi:formate/nitrite transporter family protein [Hespellia stercorisuis]|uniref:Formate/nitrite transporter n=1 Tax=Hespellia stercorisuis DSM 15480 TaxID=1121950 RepID=A0A1M6URT5_9FIRM|nr:formate/nitrite transporter family protein [Hespellia stercorisuis]SHK71962.1 formate/nitrite transporter [Hespellia stercorisuis DSM 15480]